MWTQFVSESSDEDSSQILSSGSEAGITCHSFVFNVASSYARPASVRDVLSDKIHFLASGPFGIFTGVHKFCKFAFPHISSVVTLSFLHLWWSQRHQCQPHYFLITTGLYSEESKPGVHSSIIQK